MQESGTQLNGPKVESNIKFRELLDPHSVVSDVYRNFDPSDEQLALLQKTLLLNEEAVRDHVLNIQKECVYLPRLYLLPSWINLSKLFQGLVGYKPMYYSLAKSLIARSIPIHAF